MDRLDYLQDFEDRFDRINAVEEDEDYFGNERRQYKMLPRINMEKWDDDDFVYRFRLEKRTVATVLILIENSLKFRGEPRSRFITPLTQLLIALRFYALGSMEVAIADFAGVCIASVSRIIKRVSLALAIKSVDWIQMPSTQDDLLVAAKQFFDIAKFPRTIGSIDCTHIRIQSPGGHEAELFRNRKGWFSINVQTVSSADLKIISLSCRWPGSAHDQTIFNASRLKYRFETGEFGNFIRTRNAVERSYGILKRRFPVLACGIRLKLETVRKVIAACCFLHNVAIDERDFLPRVEMLGFNEMLQQTADADVPVAPAQASRNERNARSHFVREYFPRVLAQ